MSDIEPTEDKTVTEVVAEVVAEVPVEVAEVVVEETEVVVEVPEEVTEAVADVDGITDAEFEEVVEEGVELDSLRVPSSKKKAYKFIHVNHGHPDYPDTPYVIDHQNGKPDEQMIQGIMNLDMKQEFKMLCLEKFASQNYQWIERRLMKHVQAEDVPTASQLVVALRNQIKRDKKYHKSLSGE